nr:MAG TPA: hypothetical protein [Caudoviricetes sp.]
MTILSFYKNRLTFRVDPCIIVSMNCTTHHNTVRTANLSHIFRFCCVSF